MNSDLQTFGKLFNLTNKYVNLEYEKTNIGDLKTNIVLETLRLTTEFGLTINAIYTKIASAVEKIFSQTILRQWIKKFIEGGKDNLSSTNHGGARYKKIEEEKVWGSMTAQGAINSFKTCYYNYSELLKGSPISYSRFLQVANDFLNTNRNSIRDYWKGGLDLVKKGKQPVFSQKVFGFLQKELDNGVYADLSKVSMWQLDGTKADIYVLDLEGKPFRPIFIGLIDVVTGKISIQIAKSENQYATNRLLIKTIKDFGGAPHTILTDNGKAYSSNGFDNACERAGITVVHHAPFQAEAKGKVEKVWKDLQHNPKFKMLKGYIGNNINLRQKIENATVTKAERLSGVKTNLEKDTLLTIEEFEPILNQLVSEYNQRKEKFERVEGDDIWQEMADFEYELLNSNSYLRPVRNLHLITGDRDIRTISREGISWQKSYFISDHVYDLVGEKVLIIADDTNVSQIYVAHLNKKQLKALQKDMNISTQKMEKLGIVFFVAINAEKVEMSAEKANEIKKHANKKASGLVKLIKKTQELLTETHMSEFKEVIKDVKKQELESLTKKPLYQQDLTKHTAANYPEALRLKKIFDEEEQEELADILAFIS